jgi:branched-chain amino acid transport system permease protein
VPVRAAGAAVGLSEPMDYWLDILNMTLIFSVFAMSLNLLMGYAGQVSVAHAAFGAIGGYTASYLSAHAGFDFWEGLALGAMAAGAVGLVVSLPALRLSPEYLIPLTIAVSSIVLAIVGAVSELGGAYGMVADKPADLGPWLGGPLLFPNQWTPFLLVATALVFLICRRFGESPWGRILRGVRDDEVAVRALGRDVFAFKTAIFALTAAMAGFAGVLLFYYNQLASPSVYGFNVSLQIFAMTVFGGLGNLYGSILGAAILQVLTPLLEAAIRIDPGQAFLLQLVAYGVGLAVMMRVRPQGLIPEGATLLRWRRAPPAAAPPAPVAAPVEAASVILEVRGLSKAFGGIVACRDLNLDLRQGRIAALVGPNGAGKTTVFNLLTGAIAANSGSVRLRGQEIRGLSPDRIARLGMARSFQNLRLFPRLSALDNVMLGCREPNNEVWRWPRGAKGGENLYDLFLRPDVTAAVERRNRERAFEWLRSVGLAGVADAPAGSLAFGEQKLVSLARLLGTDAQVLLLDEPASGVDSRWVDQILDLVLRMRKAGKTVCIVEHSLHVVEKLADTVFFMELGHITAEGRIADLTRDPRLAEAYFGTL